MRSLAVNRLQVTTREKPNQGSTFHEMAQAY
jgi:hypothetical protein